MMERMTTQDLAAVLTGKSDLKRKDAERFVATVFDVVKEGLAADRLVKIKGFGTFKVIDIEQRESVNVNTGERVIIEGHGRVTFTPDSAMKELVNKSFSQFETVVLNEGVTFDDDDEATDAIDTMDEPITEDPITEEPAPELPAVEPMPTEEEPEPTEEEPTPTEEDEPEPAEDAPEPEPATEEAPLPLLGTPDNEPDKDETMPKANNKKNSIGLIPALIACALCFGAGLYIGENGLPFNFSRMGSEDVETIPLAEVNNNDSTANDSATTAKPVAAAKKEKTDNAAKKENTDSAAKKEETAPAAEKPAKAEVDYTEYEKKDARVRTGAYRIVGTDYEVKAREGETVARISRRTLGPDMDCYIEVYNGLKAKDQLKEGQTVKIPKLELKKKRKKE